MAKLEWIFPGPGVLAAWRATDTLALELNLTDPATLGEVQKGAREIDTGTLPAAFTTWVRQQAQDNCLNLAQLQAMDPNFQLATITMANARRNGLEAAFGLDLMFARMARSPQRPVEALETAQEQVDALKMDMAQASEVDDLQTFSPDEQAQAQQVLLKLATAWEHSDFAILNSYAQWCQCMDRASDQQQMKRLIDDRNIHFAQRIDALHVAGHRLFAAVGSLHLIGGDQSIPALLARQGYTVQRLF